MKPFLLAAAARLALAQQPYPPIPPGACHTQIYCDFTGCRPIVICN